MNAINILDCASRFKDKFKDCGRINYPSLWGFSDPRSHWKLIGYLWRIYCNQGFQWTLELWSRPTFYRCSSSVDISHSCGASQKLISEPFRPFPSSSHGVDLMSNCLPLVYMATLVNISTNCFEFMTWSENEQQRISNEAKKILRSHKSGNWMEIHSVSTTSNSPFLANKPWPFTCDFRSCKSIWIICQTQN